MVSSTLPRRCGGYPEAFEIRRQDAQPDPSEGSNDNKAES